MKTMQFKQGALKVVIPTKKQLLAAFEKEYRAAFQKEQREMSGKLDGQLTEKVTNKYMEMDTDLFDSDDLNNIIDKIEAK